MQKQTLKLTDLQRVGCCTGCGDCCLKSGVTYNGTPQLVPCKAGCLAFYYTQPKHCQVYNNRPQACRDFPRNPWDLIGLKRCGFQFVDRNTGQPVDVYQLPKETGRHLQALAREQKRST